MKNESKTMKKCLLIAICSMCLMSHNTSAQKNVVDFVTIEEEMQLGKSVQIHAPLYFSLVRNRRVNAYFNLIAKKIGPYSDWDTLEYTVYIINEPGVYHFSLPGGNIFLSRGLVELTENDNQVAAIIAHEAVHCSQRNAVTEIADIYSYALVGQHIIGENPEIIKDILENIFTDNNSILDYGKKKEFEADERALYYLDLSDYNPSGYLTLLQKIIDFESRDPYMVRHLLRTHPETEKRYARVERWLNSMNTNTSKKMSEQFEKIISILDQIPR